MDDYTMHDSAIWHTRAIVADARAGRLALRTSAPTPFPPAFSRDEVMLAHGPYEHLAYTALGDGTYQHNGSFFFATGGLGLAATAAFMGARAAGNNRRRKQAKADAQSRWIVDGAGTAWVSQHGLYLLSTTGLWSCAWSSLTMADLGAPALLLASMATPQGPHTFGFHSDWAELAFVLWASMVHPNHPRMTPDGWIPPGWHEREAARQQVLQAPRQLEGGEGRARVE